MATTRSHVCSWGYSIVFSRFILLFLESGIAKSFGILIPMMVKRLDSDYATVGWICSLPASLAYLLFPFVSLILQKSNTRLVAVAGGVLTASCILSCAFIENTAAVGICLALSGVGFSMALVSSVMALNAFFPQNVVFMNTITLYGFTAGSMLLPFITEKTVQAYGYSGAFIILGGISFNIVACGATFRNAPVAVHTNTQEGNQHELDWEKECLIQGEALHQNVEVIRQEDTSNDGEETEDDMVDQRYRIQTETRENDKPCDLPSKTSPITSPAASLLQTCAQFCGVFNESLFLFSLPINFLYDYTAYSWMLFLVPHAEQLGIPESRAVFLSIIGGVGGVIGRTFFVILAGKGVNVFIIYITVGIICSTSFLLDFISSAYEVRAVLAFLQGFCFFIEDTVVCAICKTMILDDRNFAVAYGIAGFLLGSGASCSGLFTGYLFDVTQSFTKVFIIIGVIHTVIVIQLIIMTIKKKKK